MVIDSKFVFFGIVLGNFIVFNGMQRLACKLASINIQKSTREKQV